MQGWNSLRDYENDTLVYIPVHRLKGESPQNRKELQKLAGNVANEAIRKCLARKGLGQTA